MQLLDDETSGGNPESCEHEVKTAPLFTRDAKLPAGFCPHKSQYGLLGSVLAIKRVVLSKQGGRSLTIILLGTKHELMFRWTLGYTLTRYVLMSDLGHHKPSDLTSLERTVLCNRMRGSGFWEIPHRVRVAGEHDDPELQTAWIVRETACRPRPPFWHGRG